jgi:rhodanese-related sulfurtransferase/ABC-type phosphate/phosphonate transport system substrate-binding protein
VLCVLGEDREDCFMKRFLAFSLVLWALVSSAFADVTALVVLEPTTRKDGFMVSRTGLETNLGKLLGQAVKVSNTEDLTDAMRATRSGGYDVFIAPAQVAASAISHGYELLGSTEAEEQYVLVGRSSLASVADLRKGKIYLPQQDSIYTYLARGLLTANGMSFKDMAKVEYAHYPQAGLTAIVLRASEATVVRREDWESWQLQNAGMAKVLATSGAVPGGFSVVVKKDMAPEMRAQLTRWFATSAQTCGLKPVVVHADLAYYKKLAELGTFTPTSLPGVSVVNTDEVKKLVAQGASVVDTRTEKEFKLKHIPGALFVPYHEKSLKDVVYDATIDDFSGLKGLDAKKPVIFHCNGAECWKSYKASKSALAAGFQKVYWYRGGFPEWESAGQQVAKE